MFNHPRVSYNMAILAPSQGLQWAHLMVVNQWALPLLHLPHHDLRRNISISSP